MSADATLVTQEHFDYVAAHTRREDDFLLALKAAARAAGIPPIWISPAQASLMQILLAAVRAREVIEVGTLAGYSAIAMARALPPDGHVHTIELLAAHADFARAQIAASDVAGRVTVHEGAGGEVLSRFADRCADAMFLDADKAGYPLYLREALRLLRPGGLLLVDNAFAFGQLFDEAPTDREVAAIRRFNALLAAEPRLQSVIVPIGDGLWVGVLRDADFPGDGGRV